MIEKFSLPDVRGLFKVRNLCYTIVAAAGAAPSGAAAAFAAAESGLSLA